MRWGPPWSPKEGGPLAHAVGSPVVPKRRRPPRPSLLPYATTGPPPHGRGYLLCWASFAFGPRGPRRMGEATSFALGPPEPPAANAWGPPSLWDHRGPHHMGEGTSFALESPRPLPHGQGGLLRFGTTGDPSARARGPPSFGDHQGPAAWAGGPPSPTEAPTAWASGPPSLWDHRGPRRMGEGASFALGTTGAPAAWARGPPSLWDQRAPQRKGVGASFALGPPRPHRMGEGTSFALGSPRPLPHGRGGLLRFGITKAPTTWARGPPSLWGPPGPPPHG